MGPQALGSLLCTQEAREQAPRLPFAHLFQTVSLSVPFCRQNGSIKECAAPREVGVEHSSPPVMCTTEPYEEFKEQVACFAGPCLWSAQRLVCDTAVWSSPFPSAVSQLNGFSKMVQVN